MGKCYTIKGKGQIENMGRNKWSIRCSLGWDPITCKYKRSPRRTVEGTKAEAIDALIAYRNELKEGFMVVKGAVSVSEYANKFHEEREFSDSISSPLAYKREGLEVAHIVRFFGPISIEDLDAQTLRSSYAAIRKERLMTDGELFKMHAKLKQIMKQAYTDQIILRNPCDAVTVKKPKPQERKSLSMQEAARLNNLLVTSATSAEKCAVMIALHTGMRRGEILGLTWSRIDFERKMLYVACQWAADKQLRDPKSERSKRWVALNDDAINYLLRWKEVQKAMMELRCKEESKKCGSADPALAPLQTSSTPVVANKYGGFYDPNIFARWFRTFCVENKFGTYGEVEKFVDDKGKQRVHRKKYDGLNFHELRHTQATILIGNGADVKTVQNRLGHAQPNMTMGYTHFIADNDRLAADKLQEVLRGGDDVM